MEKNISMDRRFSLNMTHLPNPIAESTCVNLNGTTKNSVSSGENSATNQFRWGGCPISPNNRSSSNICLNNTSAVHKSRSTVTSPQRARMNLSKIDPRIYADVQSRGLVSRIVQYHENGSRLNRSMSSNNLYSKSGPASIAQLQKTELPYRATQQSVTMTRIAPPKQSVFYGNTLSSLLRSNSVISVQKSDEEISCENRPILHPPPTENELAPTRSVLDVLKEISRKRINSDDPDNVHDVNKKYCSRDFSDAPYVQAIPPADLRNMGMHGGLSKATMTAPVQSYKRQREHLVTPQQHLLRYAPNSVPTGVPVMTTQSTMQTQRSPEQIAKKRICNYNNDITSSLSSSLIHANKRKFYEQQLTTKQQTLSAKVEDYETQKSKIQRQQSDLRFQQLTKSLSCNTPITPIPTTPFSQCVAISAISNGTEKRSEVSAASTNLVQRTASEPALPYAETCSKPNKPKITLFNRDYNESSSSKTSNGSGEQIVETSKDLDEGECADIQFVKPKMSTAIVNKKNPLIERTQKSKLAMMLSGLRGEIYQGDDEVDKISNKVTGNNAKQINNTTSNENSAGKLATTISSSATTITTTTATNFIMKAPDKSVTTPPKAIISTSPESDSSTDKTAVPSSTTLVASNSSATALSTQTTNTSPALGGFKFTTSTTKAGSTTSTNTSPSAPAGGGKSVSPLVGIKLTPQKATLNFGDNTSTVAPNFNFGATTAASTENTKSVQGTIATGFGSVPQLQGFFFGSKTQTKTAAGTPTLTTAATATTSAVISAGLPVGGFKFGPTQKQAVSTAVETITAPSTAAAVTTFGSLANNIAPTVTSASTEASKPVFAFGAANTIAPAAVVKPTFNFPGGSAAPGITTAAPAFGTVASSTFTFGAAPNSTAATTSTASLANPAVAQFPSLFGGGTSSPAITMTTSSTPTPFAFGASVTTTQAANTTAPTFSFDSAVTATTNTGTPATATSNLFNFGSQKSTVVTTTATATPATSFAFGANTQTAATTANKPVFSFGGAVEGAANPLGGATKPNSSTGNLFAFGGASATSDNKLFGSNPATTNNSQAGAAPSTQPSAFTFGANAAQGASAVFGAASSATSTSAFGVTSAPSTTPFGFGANASAPAPSAGPATNSTAGGFSFGTAAISAAPGNNMASTNIFSPATSAISNQAAPTTNMGIAKSAFNFGGTTGSTNDAKSIFGGPATNIGGIASSNNTFGALATTSSNPNNKKFSFSANSATSNNPSPNPFGTVASKPAAGGFSFAANATVSKTAAVVPTLASNATPFAFGGAASGGTVTAATTPPFSFGSTNGPATANKTFTFGNSGNASAAPASNATNIFGNGAQGAPSAQQSSVPPFSFSAGPSSAPAAAPNLFAPPVVPGGVVGGGGDRPIRRATRRLQKT